MNVDDLRNEPIKIESLSHGMLEFLEFILKDMSWLDQEPTKDLPAREFIIGLIYTHLLIPKLDTEEIRNWEDKELSFVAARWLRSQHEESILSDTASFEELKEAIYTYHNALTAETRKQLRDLFASQKHLIDSVSKAISPSFYSASSGFTSSIARLGSTINLSPLVDNILSPQASLAQQFSVGISDTLVQLSNIFQKVFASTQLISRAYDALALSFPHFDITSSFLNTAQFFAGLPDLTELDALLKEAEEGNDAFKKAGYSFIMSDYISVTAARRFASINPKVRSAVITSQLAAETRKPEFEQKLKQLFEQSSVLHRRWPIISQAIKAHRRHEYNISIPPILAQVEGVIGDALILNGLVASKGHQLYEKKNGKLKLDKKNKPIAIHGVGILIQRSSWQTHPALQGVADLITTQLAGERNHILHGRKTNYGAAKLSVQGLLLLLVLGAELMVFETGKNPWLA